MFLILPFLFLQATSFANTEGGLKDLKMCPEFLRKTDYKELYNCLVSVLRKSAPDRVISDRASEFAQIAYRKSKTNFLSSQPVGFDLDLSIDKRYDQKILSYGFSITYRSKLEDLLQRADVVLPTSEVIEIFDKSASEKAEIYPSIDPEGRFSVRSASKDIRAKLSSGLYVFRIFRKNQVIYEAPLILNIEQYFKNDPDVHFSSQTNTLHWKVHPGRSGGSGFYLYGESAFRPLWSQSIYFKDKDRKREGSLPLPLSVRGSRLLIQSIETVFAFEKISFISVSSEEIDLK